MAEVSAADPLRVVFYSHDSQGMGHFRRNRALAHALASRLPVLTGRPVTGLLVNGVAGSVTSSLPAGFDVVTLPAVGKTGAEYGPRRLGVGLDAVTGLRAQIVRATLLAFRPDLVVVDRHALGFGGELEEGLRALRAEVPGARVVLGLREVLDTPAALAREWERTPVGTVRELYDQIWVYGDPRVHDLRTSGELPEPLHDLVRYQGYLSHGRAEDPPGLEPATPYLLTTVGGGSDGTRLCLAAARATVPVGHVHVVVTGPQMSDADHRAVEGAAGARTSVVRSVADAAGLIRPGPPVRPTRLATTRSPRRSPATCPPSSCPVSGPAASSCCAARGWPPTARWTCSGPSTCPRRRSRIGGPRPWAAGSAASTSTSAGCAPPPAPPPTCWPAPPPPPAPGRSWSPRSDRATYPP
ncbi:glycosyltransferase family protein [Ornithinimicrobium flavum]|uniref:glycosyltransferase family protein n=1 Tax=Ornithinimicrobium flavum TaxID=1288636 RepID=UPI0019310799|nr:glycosyl transferase family 28 [Ornithinimicrobium flavum]